MRFAGKTVVLCVTGGIAAYKAADLTSKLHQNGAEVRVLMTESAAQFISPMTFETLSGNRAVVDTFDRSFPWEVEHISLAKAADVFVIAPATANVIAKAAHGIADDMVTTTLLATKAPVVVAPAMNTGMYDNPVTQSNLETLRGRGFHIIDPAAGHLACGDSGRGKLPDTQTLINWGEYCRDMGIPESDAREIIAMKPIYVSGELHAREYSRRFDVANTEIRLQRDPNGPGGFQLLIDRQPAHAWFRQRYVELMTRLGYPVRPERPVIRRHTIKR